MSRMLELHVTPGAPVADAALPKVTPLYDRRSARP